MEANKKKYIFSFSVQAAFILLLLFVSNSAFSAELFNFVRMWPTLHQPWYFNYPSGVAFDSLDNLYVVDHGGNRIMKFNRSGQLIFEWGTEGAGNGEFDSPYGIAIDGNGNIYVSDTRNKRIQKFNSAGEFITQWGGFRWPTGLTVDNEGNLYVADNLNNLIKKFTLNGEFITQWSGAASEFTAFWGIAIDLEGNILVSDKDGKLKKFNSNGILIDAWDIGGYPKGISVDKNGFVYIANQYYIQIYSPSGVFIDQVGSRGNEDGQFLQIAGVGNDSDGNIFATDWQNESLQKFTSAGIFLSAWKSEGNSPGYFNESYGIAIDSQNNIYVADTHNDRIQKFSSEGIFIKQWSILGGEVLGTGNGVDVDSSNNVYVAVSLINKIIKYSSNGDYISEWGGWGCGNGQFQTPYDIAIDQDNYLYVADMNCHRIQKFDSNGTFITTWGIEGASDGQFQNPRGIAIDNNGYVYVADTENNRLQKFTSDGTFVAKYSSLNWPTGVTVDNSGNLLVADGKIVKLTSNLTFIKNLGDYGRLPGEIARAYDIEVNSHNNIYVIDNENNRIAVFKESLISSVNKAIIVAGGGPFTGNNLWDATQMCSNFSYRAMTYQGFTKASIYYLTSDTDLDLDNNGEPDDVDGDATNGNLQQAITTWAADADNLVIYLVDHGGDGTFRMSGSETLAAFELDTWLDQLQTVISGKVMVVYDACASGSFLTALTPPTGKDRIVISSTSPSESAYFVTQGSVSFSNFFWTHVFNGVNVKDAFDLSRQAIGYATDFQNPLIDANGNGFGNEPEDFTLVQNTYIGNGTVIHGEVPLINEVSAPQTIIDTNSALLYADDVTDTDGIARVWAVIRPPDYSAGSTTNPVQELPSLDLIPVGGNRFEATYDGFNIEGTYQIAVYARDRIGNTSIPKLTTVSVNNPLRRKAIIVAGGPSSDELWPAVETNAGLVYDTLIFQGYSDADLYFLSPVTFSAGVDGLATLGNLNYAIGTWAAESTRDVVLYLVGKGGVESFQMNSTESLTAAVLNTWLDSLQYSLPGNVAVIYDASHSGSFLNLLTPPPEKERIVISSATNNQSASFISGGDISFSTFFWQQVANGANVRDAFVHGVNAIDYASQGQTPMLDDSGNGIGNELGVDGRVARDYTIGVGIILAGDAPVIGSVSPAQTLSGPVSALLWAEDVTTTAAIERVWAVITPPGYDAGQSDGSNLTSIELTVIGAGRYEAIYSNFNLFGAYHIAVYAMDVNGSLSLPGLTTVDQSMGADRYESDDSYLEATVIQLNGAVAQRHNFHDAGDQDWVKFYAIGGEVYEVKISDVGSRADVVIELYDTDGTSLLKGPWSFGFEGEGELMDWTCAADGIYYVMIRQLNSNIYGADTGYDLEIYRPIGPGAGWVQGMINDFVTGLPVADVQVSTSGHGSAISLTNGAYVMADEAGTYTVTAEKFGYSLGSYTGVPVNEFGVTTRNFVLTPADSDNDGISDAIENSIPCLYANDDDSDDDGILDGNEDADHDGVVDAGETDPCEADTDNDGLLDGTEIGLTAPQGSDTNLGVFIADADPTTTTDPLDADSDNDGWLDGEEDPNHNGWVDPGEKDPNRYDIKVLPCIPLLLLDNE